MDHTYSTLLLVFFTRQEAKCKKVSPVALSGSASTDHRLAYQWYSNAIRAKPRSIPGQSNSSKHERRRVCRNPRDCVQATEPGDDGDRCMISNDNALYESPRLIGSGILPSIRTRVCLVSFLRLRVGENHADIEYYLANTRKTMDTLTHLSSVADRSRRSIREECS
jgi:hypothetical protein